jgi:dCTP deaminase
MGVLIDQQILERLQKGTLVFEPEIDSLQLHTHSVDLRLGYTFLVAKNWQMTDEGRVALKLDYSESREHFDVIELEQGQSFDILPNEYVIVATLEKIKLPNDLMAIMYPRSSINRQGLSVDLSGIIDAGYEGNLIIPLRNNTHNQAVRLYPGQRFCQLAFYSLEHPVHPKESRYAKKDVIMGVLKEKNLSEMKLIKSGKIKQLKEKFPLKIKK